MIEGPDGLSMENAGRFGKSVAVHWGAKGLEHYLINPTVEKMVGTEENTTKKVVSIAVNYAALLAINAVINK